MSGVRRASLRWHGWTTWMSQPGPVAPGRTRTNLAPVRSRRPRGRGVARCPRPPPPCAIACHLRAADQETPGSRTGRGAPAPTGGLAPPQCVLASRMQTWPAKSSRDAGAPRRASWSGAATSTRPPPQPPGDRRRGVEPSDAVRQVDPLGSEVHETVRWPQGGHLTGSEIRRVPEGPRSGSRGSAAMSSSSSSRSVRRAIRRLPAAVIPGNRVARCGS